MQIQATICILLCIVVVSCNSKNSVLSPDGSMRAEAFPNADGFIGVQILNAAGRQLHEETIRALAYQNWSIEWRNDSKLLIRTSDIGPTTIVKQADGSWISETPLKKLSPDGSLVAYTSWHQDNFLSLSILKAEGNVRTSSIILNKFETTFNCPDLVDCARWENNDQIIVNCGGIEHVWQRTDNGAWVEITTAQLED
jgi:hypothetical protein